MTITRMLGLRQRLFGLANPVPLAPRARISPPSSTLMPSTEKCCVCGSAAVGYHNYRDQPFCWPCADGDDGADTRIALSEATGRITRTAQRLERLAAELDARHVRYAWTEQLAADLRAIAHDTPTSETRR